MKGAEAQGMIAQGGLPSGGIAVAHQWPVFAVGQIHDGRSGGCNRCIAAIGSMKATGASWRIDVALVAAS